MEFVTDIIVTGAGVLIPAFSTHKSLQQKSPQNRLIWLRYWVVFAFYFVFKVIGDLLLCWLPFYYVAQILLILWLSSSKASGAQIVYLYAVVPILKEREQAIDRFITRHKKHASVLFWQAASELTSRWSSTACRLVRLYLETSLSDSSLVPGPAVNQPVDETERQAIQTALPPDEDMFSDEELDRDVGGDEMTVEEAVTPSKRTTTRRRKGVKSDCNFNVAGED
jgi:hypothetical protein